MSENNKYKWMVRVGCMTFNHASYIEDAMNGFTMQQTSFPFVCTIIDDASTDGEQEVIKNYLSEYFELENKGITRHEETEDYILTFARHKTNLNCYFAVLLLKYNHYSIKKPKLPYIAEWNDNAKYIAACEGDDYWIDNHKLKRQIDILEKDPQCTMVCCRTKRYSVANNYFLDDNRCYSESSFLRVEDIILKGGLYVSFCGVVFRKCVKDNYPNYCVKCHVGDYPLAIMCAMKGRVYYIDIPMAVYRTNNPQSWVGRQKESRLSEKRLNGIVSEVKMLEGFKNDYSAYSEAFNKRLYTFILSNIPYWKKDPIGYVKFYRALKEELKIFSFGMQVRMKVKYFYLRAIEKRFTEKQQ